MFKFFKKSFRNGNLTGKLSRPLLIWETMFKLSSIFFKTFAALLKGEKSMGHWDNTMIMKKLQNSNAHGYGKQDTYLLGTWVLCLDENN